MEVEYTDATTWTGAVEVARVHPTTDAAYPCGYKYTFQLYRTSDGATLLRYDNAHEREKGHERHTPEDVEQITFPGIYTLYRRFQREIPEFVDEYVSE